MAFVNALATATVHKMKQEPLPPNGSSCDGQFALAILISFKRMDFQFLRDSMMYAAQTGKLSYSMVFSCGNFWKQIHHNDGLTGVCKAKRHLYFKYPPIDWILEAIPNDLRTTSVNVVLHKNINPPEHSVANTIEDFPYYEITFDWSNGVRKQLVSIKRKIRTDENNKSDDLDYSQPPVKKHINTPVLTSLSEDVLRAHNDKNKQS